MSELRNPAKLVALLDRWRGLLDEVGILVERLGVERLEHDDGGAFARDAFQTLERELDEAYRDALQDRRAADELEEQLRKLAREALQG